MREEHFTIAYPKTRAERSRWNQLYGLNAIYAGKHWSLRKQDSEYWHLLVKAAMNRAGVPCKVFDVPVNISFSWNDNLDLDNHAYMGKMIVDAMRGRILTDDTRRYVGEISHHWHDKDYILVEVREA